MRRVSRVEAFAAALIALVMIVGCAGAKLSDVSVGRPGDYTLNREEGGVRVAVDPYFQKDRLVSYFGADLAAFGILPVLVVVEDSSGKPLLVMRENVSLSAADDSRLAQVTPAGAKEPIKKKARDAGMVGAAGAVVMPVSLIVFLPAMARAEADQRAINESVSGNALMDKSIYSGERHSGFVYFRLQPEDIEKGLGSVSVIVPEMSRGIRHEFTFDIGAQAARGLRRGE